MLTDNQKIQIQELINHCSDSQLKPVIEAAFSKWKDDKVYPQQRAYNVWGNFGKNQYEKWENEAGCCLIGSALIGKQKMISPYEDALSYFKLSPSQLDSYIFGFDGRNCNDTVSQLRKILFGS